MRLYLRIFHITHLCFTAQNQYALQSVISSGCNICVQSVSHHGDPVSLCLHTRAQICNDILIGFADDTIRITEGRCVDKGMDRACIWNKASLGQKKHLLPRKMLFEIPDGCLPGGHDLIFCHGQSHPLQLLHIDCGILGGIVGHKDIAAAGSLNGIQEILRAVNPLFSEIDRAVHIEGKAVYLL